MYRRSARDRASMTSPSRALQLINIGSKEVVCKPTLPPHAHHRNIRLITFVLHSFLRC